MDTSKKVLSIDDVLTVVNDLKKREEKNCSFYCGVNPGSEKERRKATAFVLDSYNLVYIHLRDIAAARGR